MQKKIIKLTLLTQILIFYCFWITHTAAAKIILEDKSKGMRYKVETISERLGVTWGMVFLNPDKIFFTERAGKIGILVPSSGEIIYLQGGPKVRASGQGGLLDVAVLPRYKADDWIYFTYSKPIKGKDQVRSATTLARAIL